MGIMTGWPLWMTFICPLLGQIIKGITCASLFLDLYNALTPSLPISHPHVHMFMSVLYACVVYMCVYLLLGLGPIETYRLWWMGLQGPGYFQFPAIMCGVVFNLLLAGEWLGGGVYREPDRRQLTFPLSRSFSSLALSLSFPPPPVSPSSLCLLHFILAAVYLQPSAPILYSLCHASSSSPVLTPLLSQFVQFSVP